MRTWLRQNILGLVAIFIALSGTAVATQVARQQGSQASKAGKKAKRGPRGFTGPQGSQGPQGPQGPPGPATGAAGGDLTGSYPNPQIASGAVGTSELGDLSVTPGKYSPNTPDVRVTNTASEAIANNTPTVLSFDSERYDFGGMHDNTTDNSRLVATQGTGGLVPYVISVSVQFAANATGERSVSLRENGSTIIASDSRPATAAGPTEITLSTVTELPDNASYVEAIASQTSGGSLNVVKADQFSPEFAMSMLPGGAD